MAPSVRSEIRRLMLLSQPAKGRPPIIRSRTKISYLLSRVFRLSFSPQTTADASTDTVPVKQEQKSADLATGKMHFWEPYAVFLVTLAVLALFTQRMVAYLTPVTGDEPFYLMTAISIIKDGDLNECNNYIQLDDAQLYPSFYSFDGVHAYAAFPSDWLGWRGAPFPLPPHATHLVPASRQCSSDYLTYPVNYDNPTGELYSKHGLGLSLLVLPAFALGGRLSVVFFLNILGALLAVNIYLLAREGTGKMLPAVLTWVAFAFTVPLMPYSYLIFPELPAALLIVYAFRRIRLMQNNPAQVLLVGLCVAGLPWLHYRFVPVCAALVLYYFFRDRAAQRAGPSTQLVASGDARGDIGRRDDAPLLPALRNSASEPRGPRGYQRRRRHHTGSGGYVPRPAVGTVRCRAHLHPRDRGNSAHVPG